MPKTFFKAPRHHKSKTENGMYDAPVAGYLASFNISVELCKQYEYPFKTGETVFVFGDIARMPGHCVVAKKNGKVLWGYHTTDFTPLTDEEV